MICKRCGREFDKDYRKDKRCIRKEPVPNFCSSICAHSRKQTEETKEKIAKSVRSHLEINGSYTPSESQKSKIAEKMRNNKNAAKWGAKEKRNCPNCGKEFECWSIRPKIYCGNDCWKQCSGGLRDGSVKNHHHGEYEGFRYDSSWELIWIKWALKNQIKFERNRQGFPYSFRGEDHKYYPDFYILETDTYVEIKGIQDELWAAKKESFPYKLTVIGKKEIQKLKSVL